MKKYLLIILAILLFGGVGVAFYMNQKPITHAYDFPVTPEDKEWASYSPQEMVDAYQIPSKTLKRMTTDSLIETILCNSMLTDAFYLTSSSSKDAMMDNLKQFNIYKELQKRKDYQSVLKKKYDEIKNASEGSEHYLRKQTLSNLIDTQNVLQTP